MRRVKGQSILEYVIVLTAIIAAIVIAATNFIGKSVNSSLGSASNSIAVSASLLPGANGM